MIVGNRFNLGDKVFLKTDPDQREYIVCEVVQCFGNVFSYRIAHNITDVYQWEQCLTSDRDTVKALTE